MCFDFVYNFGLKPNSLCEVFSEISYAFIHIHVKQPLFLSHFNKPSILSTNFRKIPKCKITCKSVQWEPSSMRKDKQTRWSYYSLFAILRTRLKTHPHRIRCSRYLQAKAEAAIPTKEWVGISLNYFSVSGNQSPRIRACNFNTAFAACEHKAVTGVRRDAVCTLY
jgi:hypothetical protein